MADLSVVIVNWNAGRFLSDCLRSLLANQPHRPWEVIVVDNASTDGSPDAVRREFPAVKLAVNSSNLGFAAASNLGARISSSKYILFLNPDTIVPPKTLDRAAAFMEAHAKAGVMGCKTMGEDGRVQPTAFDFPSTFRVFGLFSGLNRYFKVTRLKDLSRTRTPDYVQGSFFLIRRETFEAVGGFDEGFFMYGEDVDLCLKVRRSGKAVFYVPDMTITHHGSGSATDSLGSLENYIRSLTRLYTKYKRPGDLRKLRRAMGLGLRLRELFWAGRMVLGLRPISRDTRKAYRVLLLLTKTIQTYPAGPPPG